MKKSFWGYNVAEVDENISFLETQNIKLERQVKQLTRELDEARSANAAAGAAENGAAGTAENGVSIAAGNAAGNGAVSASENGAAENGTAGAAANAAVVSSGAQARIDELEAHIAALTAENTALTERAAALENENAQLGARLNEPSESETIERIGDICMSAYSDMNAAKHRTREQLEEYLGRFWGEWQGCRDRLTELASQLEEKQAQSRESFVSYADYILRAYGDMRDDSARLRDGMSELTAAEEGIREGMERLLHELDGELPETAAEPEPVEAEAEEEDEPEQGYSIINAVRILERARKRRDAGRAAHESEAARNGADGVSNGGSDGAAKGEYGSAVNGGFRGAARGEFSGTAKVGSENAADGAHAGSSSDMAKNDAEKAAGGSNAGRTAQNDAAGSSNAERTARNGAAGGEARPTGIFGDVNLRNII